MRDNFFGKEKQEAVSSEKGASFNASDVSSGGEAGKDSTTPPKMHLSAAKLFSQT